MKGLARTVAYGAGIGILLMTPRIILDTAKAVDAASKCSKQRNTGFWEEVFKVTPSFTCG